MTTKNNNNVVANDFIDILQTMIRQETSKLDTTIVCRIVEVNNNGTYNVYVEPDETNVITNISSIANVQLIAGDYVYVYKIRNQLNNSFIIKKIGNDDTQTVEQTIKNLQLSVNDLKDSNNLLVNQISLISNKSNIKITPTSVTDGINILDISGKLTGTKYNSNNPNVFLGYTNERNNNIDFILTFKGDSNTNGLSHTPFVIKENESCTPSQALVNGFYYVASNTKSLSGADANPFLQYHSSNADFRILTTSYNGSSNATWLQQIATDFRSNHIFFRRRENGTWKDWVEIALSSEIPSVPTKTSQLNNDSGFITKSVDNLTNYTKSSALAVVATSGNYNDLTNQPTIPIATSNLINDSGFIDKNVQNLANYTITNDFATVAFTGDYEDLKNQPLIPTKTSQLTNDSYFAYINETNTFAKPQKIVGNDSDGDTSGQPALLKVLNTKEATTSSTWQGRIMAGSKNKTFLLGTYKDMCGIGAHSWTDSEAGEGAAWEPFYINPDGNQAVYIGYNTAGWSTTDTGILKIDNSDHKAYYKGVEIATTNILKPGSPLVATSSSNQFVFNLGAGSFNGLYVFSFGNCNNMITLYNNTPGTTYKQTLTFVYNTGGSVVTTTGNISVTKTGDNYYLTIKSGNSQMSIVNGFTGYLFKVKLY